ncbi:MAG: type II toxin-antitoxin system MqsA family antitoxin [Acidimicrobiia bacterium]|nr:type II toxin-antitoxin system MqsA family antitoxin [Acidimicrobiia bacterium]
MTCTICKNGSTSSGTTTVLLQRGPTTIVLKDVPADICDNCGEYFLSEAVTTRTLGIAEQAAARNAEVEIVRFAA